MRALLNHVEALGLAWFVQPWGVPHLTSPTKPSGTIEPTLWASAFNRSSHLGASIVDHPAHSRIPMHKSGCTMNVLAGPCGAAGIEAGMSVKWPLQVALA